MESEERQAILDEEHLRLLSIGFIIDACVSLLTALAGVVYAIMGTVIGGLMMREAERRSEVMPAASIGGIFVVFGLAFMCFFGVLAVLKFMTARRLRQRRSRTMCQVCAAISVIGIPYGTALGVFTFLVLARPSVRSSFTS